MVGPPSILTSIRFITFSPASSMQIQGNCDREMAVARQLVAQGSKGRALLALKRRALQEQQLAKLEAWLLNVEERGGGGGGGLRIGGGLSSLWLCIGSVSVRAAPGRKAGFRAASPTSLPRRHRSC